MSAPISTYRLQIRQSFDLQRAAEVLDYLAALGADWVYLSPLLTAEQGSDHGYDVTDHSSIDSARGGSAGLEALCAAARDRGLGILIDIVPNHVGVATPAQNPWWWDLLTHGRASRYAEAFDVDWEFGGGKIRIPVLGETESPPLEVRDGCLWYYDTKYPIAPGTADDGASAEEVHSRQNYELVHWTRADAELNYRRFFAVNTLAAIRVEEPWVFDESHAEILRWIHEGLADGLRVDHPDGLQDPGGYLDRLAEATGGTYVLVEKILEHGETLPAHWQTAGTTGYDALADIDRVLIDPAGRERLDALDSELRGTPAPVEWEVLIHGTKRGIADGILRSEVLRLDRLIPELDAADALAELLACFPVYRSYLPVGAEHLQHAAELALRFRPDLSDTIHALLPILGDPAHPAAIRFQQTSGMVMAKGVEDTAFYRFSRLSSLTEVGGDPSEFAIGPDEFHRRQAARHAGFPLSMTALSTHDTKRGEDTRARIDVLAELPERWAEVLGELRRLAPVGDGVLENLLWSSFVGAWPASRERLHAYAEKASREAGSSTTWTAPNEEFEARMHAMVDAAFDNREVAGLLGGFADEIAGYGWSNSLSAKLIQLTAPGVPDVYQGSELWETSLVDPDNRRPVDFEERRRILADLDAGGALPPVDAGAAAKLLVTSRALRLRRDRTELFTRYTAVPVVGEAADHLVAFDRGGAITLATRLPVGLERHGGWGDTAVAVPGRPMTDVITGRRFPGGLLRVGDILDTYPVALLAPTEP
ncbi:malto-oligosyltrehalose synthase [Lysobacter korlensis]|uniref:Malto-oligosyltrehalose synthase n=1 Tax=Lysobacter korlensis TaxID=553636 RepID=A0ABV6RN88_9GAMM